MEDARRRWQEKQDAKAAKYMEDKKLVSIIIILPILFTIFFKEIHCILAQPGSLWINIHVACAYIQFKAHVIMLSIIVSMVYFMLDILRTDLWSKLV